MVVSVDLYEYKFSKFVLIENKKVKLPKYQLQTTKMLAEEIREYCLNKKGVTEGFPFDETTLVFKVGGKMFLLMALEKQPLVFSAKNTADYNVELREQYYQISGAYHMNKTHWNSVICEGLKPEFIKKLIDDSYQLVFDSLTKKLKEEVLKN